MSSPFSHISYEAPDPIFEVKAAFDQDQDPSKINLGPGAYLDDRGEPWILPSVAGAERLMASHHPGHEYLPILGLPAFRKGAREVAFGDGSRLLTEDKIASIQAISGTGAVRLAIQFLHLFHNPSATVYVSDPSWSNHRIMFEYAGFEVKDYPYYDSTTRSVAFDAMIQCMNAAAPGSIFVLHACAHNPTGCDLSQDQWRIVSGIIQQRHLLAVLDSAYQGFASGDLVRDGWVIRHIFEEMALPGLLCQSFSKSMGLYGERAGALHVVVPTGDAQLVRAIESQIGWISRKEISTAPRYGATIAATVISQPELYSQWQEDLQTMSGRIAAMRQAVLERLETLRTPGTWTHITEQIGMFSYTGLSPTEVNMLKARHIYMAESGRISMSGLNEGNLEYFCRSVDQVVRQTRG